MSPDSRARRSRIERFGADARGQSETIAVVLILAMTVFGTGAIIMLGSGALADAKETSRIQSTEHAMTLFDSRSAMVALGDSPDQSVDLGRSNGGSYAVRDGGWIRVEHRNFTGKGDNETIYNASLGAVVYRNGGTEIAYQGGGVWRREDGGTVMVSPPEFHYRDATLTLPIIRVAGEGSATGGRIGVSSTARTRRVFPNATGPTEGNETGAPYDDAATGSDQPYANPVKNGHINVTVHSEYYEGWAQYFETRTEGNVTVDDANRTATVQLATIYTNGNFDLSSPAVKIRGKNGPLNAFNVTFSQGSPKKFYWSFWAESGSEEFEVHVASKKACDDGSPFFVTLYYHDAAADVTHQWYANVDPDSDEAFDLTCGSDAAMAIDFLGSTDLTYGQIEGSNEGQLSNDHEWYFSFDEEMNETATIDDETVAKGENESIDVLINHYLTRMGSDVTLRASTAHGDLGGSNGRIHYPQGGDRYITYLHITENRVEVRFE